MAILLTSGVRSCPFFAGRIAKEQSSEFAISGRSSIMLPALTMILHDISGAIIVSHNVCRLILASCTYLGVSTPAAVSTMCTATSLDSFCSTLFATQDKPFWDPGERSIGYSILVSIIQHLPNILIL